MVCKICGSYAINQWIHGRKEGIDTDLCDVCYWRKRSDKLLEAAEEMCEHGVFYSNIVGKEKIKAWKAAIDAARKEIKK